MAFDDKYKFFNELAFFTLSNAAPGMSKFFKDTITISSPKTELKTFGELQDKLKNMVHTTIQFNKGEVGQTHVFFEEDQAFLLAKYAIETKLNKKIESKEWDELTINAVEEVVNILGGNMTEILTVVFGKGVDIEVPELDLEKESVEQLYQNQEKVVMNTFVLHLGTETDVVMHELASQSYYENLIKELKKRI